MPSAVRTRGREAGEARDGRGRKAVPPKRAQEIQSRLREFLTRGGEDSLAEFKKNWVEEFEPATVNGWFRRGRVPDASTILRLAEKCGLSPSYLLLGAGMPEADVSTAAKELEPALRQTVLEELMKRFPNQPNVVRRAVPWGSEIIEELVTLYEERVKEELSRFPAQLRLRALQKLVEEPDLNQRHELAKYVRPMLNLAGPLATPSAPRGDEGRMEAGADRAKSPTDREGARGEPSPIGSASVSR